MCSKQSQEINIKGTKVQNSPQPQKDTTKISNKRIIPYKFWGRFFASIKICLVFYEAMWSHWFMLCTERAGSKHCFLSIIAEKLTQNSTECASPGRDAMVICHLSPLSFWKVFIIKKSRKATLRFVWYKCSTKWLDYRKSKSKFSQIIENSQSAAHAVKHKTCRKYKLAKKL